MGMCSPFAKLLGIAKARTGSLAFGLDAIEFRSFDSIK